MTSETKTQRTKVWLLTAAIVIAVGAAVFATANFLLVDDITEESTFDLVAVTEIRTVVEAGNIEVRAGDHSDIRVVTVLTSGLGSDPQSEVTLEGGVLFLKSECRSFIISTCRVAYRITVPRDAALTLNLQTTAGNVELAGAAGPVAVRTTAGNIDVRDHVGEEAELRTTAGNVSFEASNSPKWLSIETTAGSITARVPDVGYRIEAETTVGRITVDLVREPDAEHVIEARTTTGSITLVGP
jgi:hypothetical protein